MCSVDSFEALDTGTTTSTVNLFTLVARPGLVERNTERFCLDGDLSLGEIEER